MKTLIQNFVFLFLGFCITAGAMEEELETSDSSCVDLKFFSKESEIQWTPNINPPPPAGIYQIELAVNQLYPLDKIYDVRLYLLLPPQLIFVNESARINGVVAPSANAKGFLVISANQLPSREVNRFEINAFINETNPFPEIKYVLLAKTKNGKTITPLKCGAAQKLRTKVLEHYLSSTTRLPKNKIEDPLSIKTIGEEVSHYGIIYPRQESSITPSDITQIEIAVPNNAHYDLKINDNLIDPSQVTTKHHNQQKNVKVLSFHEVELLDKENQITLTVHDDIVDHRKITVQEQELNDNLIDKSHVNALTKKDNFGFLFPEQQAIITSSNSTKLEIAIPKGASFQLLVNEESVEPKKLAYSADNRTGTKTTLTYLGVQLADGFNHLILITEDEIISERVITVTNEIRRLSYQIYPDKPPADGKTPAYVVIRLLDENGQPIKQNAYLNVFSEDGEIFDPEENQFHSFPDGGLNVPAYAGKATFKLSPSSNSEKRRVTVVYEDILIDFDVRFYPEKRPWIIVGGAEGIVSFSDTKRSNDALVKFPADHSEEGTNVNIGAGIFAKGSVGDYTVTAMYDSDRSIEEGTLLEQNTPSTEEGEFYPVYGDDSEQYFETKTQRNAYVKVEKDLSYAIHGDFQTDYSDDLQYNVYRRTLHGQQVNIEKENDYRINAIFSENSQDIIKEEQKGRGISGPYFFRNGTPIEFSERILIEVRDRLHPDIIISQTEKRRFTDYTVNYSDGWVLFHEPVHEFDSAFNPIFIIMIYESERDGKEEPIWGTRLEKTVFNHLTLGGTYVLEEHFIRDKKLAGIDLIYDNGERTKFIAEYAETEAFQSNTLLDTDGDALRLEWNYTHPEFRTRGWYTDVDGGFQNPSATNALTGHETFGLELGYDFLQNSTLSAEAYSEKSDFRETKVVGGEFTHRMRIFDITAGLRWKEEDNNLQVIDDVQGIIGANFYPFEKLRLNVRHEQSFGSDETDQFPDRTVLGGAYRLTKYTSFNVQHEIRRQRQRDSALTVFGMDSEIEVMPNTTAYMKYSIDDSISDFRSQSHLGLDHRWLVREDFTVDFGGENVQTLDGDSTGDHFAIHSGFQYVPLGEKYRLTGQYETRLGRDRERRDDHVVRLGGTLKLRQSTTFFLRERFLESERMQNDLLFGLAYRPVYNDRWNHLFKLRNKWERDELRVETMKFLGSWHANFQYDEDITLMGEYAWKYQETEDNFNAFTYLVRGRFLWDITDRIDANAHVGVMHQTNTNNITFVWGPELGYKIFRNLWLSGGYNFSGFHDYDFEDAEYWNKGFYLKLRFKFDESILEIFKPENEGSGEELMYDGDDAPGKLTWEQGNLP